MKLRYTAHSPADSDDALVNAELSVPDDASDTAIIGVLVNAVERESGIETGEQVRVIAWHRDEDEPFIWHTWDHGASG